MSTTREEVMATLGIDISDLEKGLGISKSHMSKFVQEVRAEDQKQTAWMEVELKKREELEVAAAVRAATLANKARRLLREREAARQLAEAEAQKVANKEIAQGSGGYGWLKKGAEAGGTALAGGAAAKALGGVAKEGVAAGGVFRELFVIGRELAAGRTANAIRSVTILVQRLAPALTRLSTAVPLVGLAIAAAYTAFESIRARKASQEYDKSLNRERNVTERLAMRLREDIANMEKAHRISKEVADRYLTILSHPTIERASFVAKQLRPYGDTSKHDAAEIARLNEDHLRKLIEFQREGESLEQKHINDQLRVTGLKHDMAQIDRHSLEYAKKQLELDDAMHDLQEDDKKIAGGKLDMQRKLNEEQAVYRSAQLEAAELHQREFEKFMPTLQELAQHGGAGGHAARMIEREDRRIKRDFFHGDTTSAGRDIAQRTRLYDSLASRGLTPERSELRDMRRIQERMDLSLKRIADAEAILKVKISMG